MLERGLYGIVDPAAVGDRDPTRVAAAILAGGCARLQLRWKHAPDGAHLALARRLADQCRRAGVPFVVNDRPDLARLCGAEGLHLGQDDPSLADARRVVGDEVEIGVSTHDLEQAEAAAAQGADLIAFGPVFATASKVDPEPVVSVEGLTRLCQRASRPVVAIGGVTVARAGSVLAAGASFGAAISAICGAEDPEAAARALHAALGGTALGDTR